MSLPRSKADIRKDIRHQRITLDSNTHLQNSHAVCERILSINMVNRAQHIATYCHCGHEINLTDFNQQCFSQQKSLYLPVIGSTNINIMEYFLFSNPESLVKNRYGILEPDTTDVAAIEPHQLDVIIIPLVAFDSRCNRLGQGAGYYDRYLSQFSQSDQKPLLIGVGHDFQLVDKIPVDQWDQPLDFVVTNKAIYSRHQ